MSPEDKKRIEVEAESRYKINPEDYLKMFRGAGLAEFKMVEKMGYITGAEAEFNRSNSEIERMRKLINEYETQLGLMLP